MGQKILLLVPDMVFQIFTTYKFWYNMLTNPYVQINTIWGPYIVKRYNHGLLGWYHIICKAGTYVSVEPKYQTKV
jgi:hypothetical protein